MKKEKVMMIMLPILCVLLIGLSFIRINNDLKEVSEDSIKFKEEYESLNNKKIDENRSYLSLDIDPKNVVKYSTFDEIIDVIKNKTGVIYFGFPECPWCRNLVPVLLEAAKENNIDTIYYLNIKNERDTWEVVDGKLQYKKDENNKEIKGSTGYFKLLEVLDEHLSDYKITFEDKTYEVGEKRLYAPTVVFVRDGKILNVHVGTVSTQKNPYEKLTNDEYDELYNIFEDSMQDIKRSTCSLDSAC